jgi:hypothetical protein
LAATQPVINEFGKKYYTFKNVDYSKLRLLGEIELLTPVVFNSQIAHNMAKAQWEHMVGNWSAPDGAAKFIREIYKLHGGKLTLPFKGHEIGIADKSNVCKEVKPALKGM